jgi:hypothetical protein
LIDFRTKEQEAVRDGKPAPKIPDYIGQCFMKIIEGASRMPSFNRYSFKEDMVSDAIENCVLYFRNYDEKISPNPYGYFTQVTVFAFYRRIAKEKRELYVKYKLISMSNVLDCITSEDREYFDEVLPSKMYDNINDYISEYETKEKVKKEEKAKKKKGLEKFYESPENTDESGPEKVS